MKIFEAEISASLFREENYLFLKRCVDKHFSSHHHPMRDKQRKSSFSRPIEQNRTGK
jgi:hypothetical protein